MELWVNTDVVVEVDMSFYGPKNSQVNKAMLNATTAGYKPCRIYDR
jgi:hypothetical protein